MPQYIPFDPRFHSPSHHPYAYPSSSDDEEYFPPEHKHRSRKDPKKHKKQKFLSKQEKQKRRKRLAKVMKKVFYAVAYTVFLKNLVKKIREKRKITFNNYWP